MNDELSIEPADDSVRLNDLVLDAMRIAEKAHRGQKRKAPAGLDQPGYFLHVSEVAWRLKSADMSDAVIAAGYLHDVIEDCGYTRDQLAEELGSPAVADMVLGVTEPEKAHNSWQARNSAYLNRIKDASREVIAISVADKTTNMVDMLRLVRQGYALSSFLSVGASEQLQKFQRLRAVFANRAPKALMAEFDAVLAQLYTATADERHGDRRHD